MSMQSVARYEDTSSQAQCEIALLGTLLSNPSAHSLCADLLPEDFAEHLHARIFAFVIDQIARAGKVFAPAVITHFLKDESLKSANVSASQYIAMMIANASTPSSLPYLSQIVKNDSALRALSGIAHELSERSCRPEIGETAVDIAAFFSQKIADVSASSSQDVRKSKFDVQNVVADIIEAANDRFQNGVVPNGGAYSGTSNLNRVFNGWKRGRYYVIAGRPGMGKTTVAQSLLIRTAGKGHPVLFFSLEMGADELGFRILSDIAYQADLRIEYQSIERQELTESGLESLIIASDKLKSSDFTIYDKPNLTLSQIRALCLREDQRLKARGKRLEVIAVDHIGLMRASERYSGNKVAETEEISIGLKALAKELDIAVVALVQLNRGPDSREDKRPSLSDLRWSGSIEQDADAVILCYRPEYYLERSKCDDPIKEADRLDALSEVKNKMELIVAKHRGGACPSLEMYCDIACSAVRDMQA